MNLHNHCMIHFLLAINFSMHGSPLFLHNIIFGDNPINASREKLRQRIIIVAVVFSEVSMGTTSL